MKNRYGGVLLICVDTGNFLLLKRSDISTQPGTWSIVSGGIDPGEEVLEGIKRELEEETGINSDEIDYKFFENQLNMSPYFDFYIGTCNKEYNCDLKEDENTDWGWFNMDNLPEPLFPTLYSSLVRIF